MSESDEFDLLMRCRDIIIGVRCAMNCTGDHDCNCLDDAKNIIAEVRAKSNAAPAPKPPPKVVGKVTGKVYEGDQSRGMTNAICHACGLGYRCWNIDCEQTGEAPSIIMGPPKHMWSAHYKGKYNAT